MDAAVFTHKQRLALCIAVGLLGACSSEDAAADAAAIDGSTERDAGAPDGAAEDAPAPDALAADAATPDAAAPDATPASCGYAGNLVTNCGLESDTTDWSAAFNSTISHSTSKAHTGTGSLQMEMVALPGQSNWSAVYSDCFVLSADTTYTFGAWAREIAGDPVNLCHAQLHLYSGVTDCSGAPSVQVAPTIAVDATWKTSEGSHTASAGGDSARIHIRCQGGTAGSQVLVDDVYLRP